MNKIILSTGLLLLLLGCSGGGGSSSIIKSKIFTQNDTINVQNPDRGFYHSGRSLTQDRSYNIFQEAKDKGRKLVFSAINLQDYITTSTLDNNIINIISTNLADAKSLGIRLILRLKYRDSLEGIDPSKEVLLSHLKQLKTILQNHKDTVSLVQVGSIGAWGEWHTFTGDYAQSNPDYLQNRKDLIEKLLEIFPDKFIQIRTPMHKESLYGSPNMKNNAMITPELAFTQDIRAKIGHHNDCFLASSSDEGTYDSDDLDFWRNYVINDSKYTPTGGETCADNKVYTQCTNAIAELKLLKWSFINESYHLDVIQGWKDDGCYQEINENVGYKFVADTAILKKDEETLTSILSIKNLGYSAPYVKSNIEFTLSDNNQSYSFSQKDIDLRSFQPDTTLTIERSLALANVKKGEYCLYMKIGEDAMSIALANEGTWDETTQSNKLMCGIAIE